jgi:hypothetical protein
MLELSTTDLWVSCGKRREETRILGMFVYFEGDLSLVEQSIDINRQIPDPNNGAETIFSPSHDAAIIDLAIAGESFSRIARHLGAGAKAVQERYAALVREQGELLKTKVQHGGPAESKSKTPEKDNAKSSKNEAKDKKPDNQKAKSNDKDGGKSLHSRTVPA